MTKLADLLRTLDDRAAQAPDGLGLIEAAQRGATRIRKRRRVIRLAAAAAVVAVVAVGVPTGLRMQAARVIPAVPDRARTAQDMTLEVGPVEGLVLGDFGTSASGQFQSLSVKAAGAEYFFDVYAYPPGSPDRYGSIVGSPKQAMSVRGREASLQDDGFFQTLNWRFTDGTLIAVRFTARKSPSAESMARLPLNPLAENDRALLLSVAEAIQIGKPRPVPAPIRFGWLPPGLTFTGITSRGEPGKFTSGSYINMTLTFPTSAAHDKRQVDVNVTKRAGTKMFRETADINGFPGYFGHPSVRRDSLVVRTPTCDIEFLTSPGMTEAEIIRMAEDAEFYPCSQPTDWKPPMG
ncbi:hypothetical protein [Actinoplanes sp. NPDC089786]|uniref:hypothetical protein n=1 Tax=Actinoplanes sp. NPDC089786 TaxID=3155185 RepID=UPI00342D41AB